MDYPKHNLMEDRIKHYFQSQGHFQENGDLFKEFYLASTRHIDKLGTKQITHYRASKKALFEARLDFLRSRERSETVIEALDRAIAQYISVRESLGFPRYEDYGLMDPFNHPTINYSHKSKGA